MFINLYFAVFVFHILESKFYWGGGSQTFFQAWAFCPSCLMDKTALHPKPIGQKTNEIKKGVRVSGFQVTVRVLFHSVQNSCRSKETASHALEGNSLLLVVQYLHIWYTIRSINRAEAIQNELWERKDKQGRGTNFLSPHCAKPWARSFLCVVLLNSRKNSVR